MINLRKITENITLGLLDLKAFSLQHGISVKREQEKAGARFLLKALLNNDDFELAYTAENKPYLKNNSSHISISHSHDKLVIIMNRLKNTGIDIELMREKVIAVRHKFLNDAEWNFAQTDVEKLITIWAAKEAMYKAHGLKGVDFQLHLFVQEFEGKDLSGRLVKDGLVKKYHLVKEILEDYVMVYILDEQAGAHDEL